uniref:Uncharacterized protein n=1 Tax=Psilocybe cubensis TaxID=181762 RepID=A0A8H7XZF4_PSICU
MPVTFDVAPHHARPIFDPHRRLKYPQDLLIAHISRIGKLAPSSSSNTEQQPKVICMQSSFSDGCFTQDIRCERNGFVQAVTHAYNRHHNLVIRPDDVWVAILSQFSLYVNKNSENLRSQFVDRKGKKKLIVQMPGTRHTSDFGNLATQMTELISQNIVNTKLKSWILPGFTTTTPHDIVVCSVLMMATMKSYFDYEMSLCGLPSVTLEGEKSDWEKLYAKLDLLETFGKEPENWVKLLRPVFKRFVQAFDGKPDIDFWNKVSHHYSLGSGTRWLSGWITAFCVWDSQGNWQAKSERVPVDNFGKKMYHPCLEVDGIRYPSIDSVDIPMGFCQVDIRVIDGEGTTDCVMVSGHMANVVEGDDKDTLRPLPSWFMYKNPESKTRKVEEMSIAEEEKMEDTIPDPKVQKTLYTTILRN